MNWDKINFDFCSLKKNPETLSMQSFGILFILTGFSQLLLRILNSFHCSADL